MGAAVLWKTRVWGLDWAGWQERATESPLGVASGPSSLGTVPAPTPRPGILVALSCSVASQFG